MDHAMLGGPQATPIIATNLKQVESSCHRSDDLMMFQVLTKKHLQENAHVLLRKKDMFFPLFVVPLVTDDHPLLFHRLSPLKFGIFYN